MMQPAMMLIILAYLGSFVVMRAPESGLAVGMSLFPTIDAVRDDAAHWRCRRDRRSGRCSLSVALLVGSTGGDRSGPAGRIFRVGLLMQGKPPNLPELAEVGVAVTT